MEVCQSLADVFLFFFFLHLLLPIARPDPAAPPPARRQAPLKAEAPLLLEVWDAVLAGLDAAALLAAPAACFREPGGARRAAQPEPGLMQEARAALDRELRAAAALKQARPAAPAPFAHQRGGRLRKGVGRCTASGLHMHAPHCACRAGKCLARRVCQTRAVLECASSVS